MKGRRLNTARSVGLAVAAAVLSSAALPGSPAAAVPADGAGHRCALPTAYVVNFYLGTVTPIRTRTNTPGRRSTSRGAR